MREQNSNGIRNDMDFVVWVHVCICVRVAMLHYFAKIIKNIYIATANMQQNIIPAGKHEATIKTTTTYARIYAC